MKRVEFFLGVVVLVGSLGLATRQSWAEAAPLFGRVSAVAGQVEYRSAGEGSAALVNEPAATGTGLRTAQDAETELRAPGARIALAPSSTLQILRLDSNILQIAVLDGRVGLHLAAASQTVEIDLPQGGVWLEAPGDYDIFAGDARTPAVVQVFAGKARLGGGLDDSHIVTAADDWFSDWWRSRSDAADLSNPPLPKIAGARALAEAGRWEHDSALGEVWYPSDVAADWTPYRDGAWRFLAPWGWTWIDNAPWGFAPAHYGRWARVGDRWGWAPGDQIAAADYNPAQVAFLGTAGIGLSRPGDIGAMPAVAWFPLAPGETVGDADGDYKNRRFATAVPRADFAAGLPVAIVDDIPERRFAEAPVILASLGIAPGPAVAPKKPVRSAAVPVATAAASPPAAVPSAAAPAEAPRQPFVVALRDAPVRTPVKIVQKPLRLRVAASLVLRTHHLVLQTRHLASALRSPHNRTRFAAARGGA